MTETTYEIEARDERGGTRTMVEKGRPSREEPHLDEEATTTNM